MKPRDRISDSGDGTLPSDGHDFLHAELLILKISDSTLETHIFAPHLHHGSNQKQSISSSCDFLSFFLALRGIIECAFNLFRGAFTKYFPCTCFQITIVGSRERERLDSNNG